MTAAAATIPCLKTSPVQLKPLTSVRFFAAFAVMAFHFGGDAMAHLPQYAQRILEHAYVSVSFFFVLSGFILAYTYLNGTTQLRTRDFYLARFARIYPVYAIGFTLQGVFLVKDMMAGNSLQASSLAISGIITLLLLQSWVVTSIIEWNVPGWSLSTEAFFYLVFPAAAGLVRKLSARWVGLSFVSLSALLFIPAVVDLSGFQGTPTAHQLDLLGCSPILRSLEFLIGVVAGRWFVIKGRRRTGSLLSGTAAASILIVLAGSPSGSLQWWREKVLVILFTAFVLGLASSAGALSRFLAHPFLVALGQASYALYILHWPLYTLALKINGVVRSRPADDAHPGSVFFLLYATAAVALSMFVFHAIEQPARRYLRVRWG